MSEGNYATIYIVRHGQTDWNVQNLVQGQTDIPLNMVGEDQARQLAATLKKIHFDAVFSSDLVRAKRTAEILTLERELMVQTTELLREQFGGKYEGTDREEFLALFTKWGELSDEERHHYVVIPDMESNDQAVTRFLTFLREIGVGFAGKTVLVVSHGAVMRYLVVKLGYRTYDNLIGFNNTGYIKLRTDGVDFFSMRWSEIRRNKFTRKMTSICY